MTTRTPRQHSLDRALARILANSGGYLVPANILRAEACLHLVPEPSTGELDDSIRHMDTQRRIDRIPTETGDKFALTDTGRLWQRQNP